MAEWQYDPTTTADMLAAFPYKSLPPIQGKPTLHTLLQTLKLLCKCSQKIKSGLGPLGYLFVALPVVHYQRFTAVPLVLPGPTPQLPTYPAGTNTSTRDNIKLTWQAHKAENDNIRNMNEALLTLFLAAIDPAYKRHLENDLVGVTQQNFWDVFSSFLDKYGRVTPIDHEQNLIRMKRNWDAQEPIETLFAQINDANEYSIFAGTPFQEHDLIQAAEMLVLRTGQFSQEYKDWRALPDNLRTWNGFQDWWQRAYNLKEETNITASDLNYAANLQKDDDEDTLDTSSLTHFGEAFAANSTVISQLSEANNTMNETLQGNIMSLQGQIESMNQALQHIALNATRQEQPVYQSYGRGRRGRGGRGRGRGGRNNAQAFPPPAFPGMQPPPPQQAPNPYLPPIPAIQNQAFQAPRPPQGFQNFNQNPQFQRNIPPLAPQQQQFCPPATQNPYKRYHNWNYCWTHGHDISDNHTSANCQNPAPGHVWHATKQNTCGGTTKGQHKIMYPIYNYSLFNQHCSLNIISPVHSINSMNEDDDDEDTVVTSNVTTTPGISKATHGLLDSGATDHFLAINSHVKNKRPSKNKINVEIPDGNNMESSEECDLDWPTLPAAARTGHILKNLKNYALVSVVKLCDAGCNVIFKHDCCLVIYKKKIIMYGIRCPRTRLWMVPLSLQHQHTKDTTRHDFKQHHANSIHHMANQRNLVEYLHQCFFSPPASTLIKAIRNDQLLGVPGFTMKAVNKWLPVSTATIKGHMNRTRKNLRSTRKTQTKETNEYEKDMEPEENKNAKCELFCFAALAEDFNSTIYSDATGKFPVPSYHGNRYVMIVYVYDANAILVRPMKNREKETMVETFQQIYDFLIKRNMTPKLHVMDNECSKLLSDYIQNNNTTIQFVEAHNHKINAAERAIQTFKNHFVAGLCTAHPQFPLQLWCELLPQAEISLNLLRRARCNNKLSAYAVYNGEFNFDKTPLAPPGTKALVFEDPSVRNSWAPHAKDAWYVSPAMQHYRCFKFFVPSTRGFTTAQTAKFFPSFSTMPTLSNEEFAILTARELVETLKNMKKSKTLKIKPAYKEKLIELAKIFNDALPPKEQKSLPEIDYCEPPRVQTKPPPRVENTPSPRVNLHNELNQPTQSYQPTSPTTVLNTPITHQRTTRNNKPAIVPEDDASVPPPPTQPRRSQRLHMRTPAYISQQAINSITRMADNYAPQFTPRKLSKYQTVTYLPTCNAVVHPVTGETITNYKKLLYDNVTKPVWEEAMCKELGRLAQGYEKTEGTSTVTFMRKEDIANIPKDRTVTYARIVVDYRPQKKDPNRVRITAGGNLIQYPYELTTRTADLPTSKILWNSVISTPGARYMCIDIKNMYLATPMDRYEYMRMPMELIPEKIIELYGLREKCKNGYVYMQIERGMYGLPQAGILANKLLRKRLEPHGYYEVDHTPGLWRHKTLPVQFTLVVDDFGVKYQGKENAMHLINALKEEYEIDIDWKGELYCGVSLKWNYEERYVDSNMPGYAKKQLKKYNHVCKRKVHTPLKPLPKKYGQAAQEPMPVDDSKPLEKDDKKFIERVVGSFLFYGRAVDPLILHTMNTIANSQSKPTENTMEQTKHFLDYIDTYPDSTIRYYASDMILNVHSDASYLTAPKARSRIGGHFFLGRQPVDNQPIFLNGPILSLCTVLRNVAASAAEAELGALFHNAKETKVIRLILKELGHPQPPTPIHVDNTTVNGIVNNTIKRQRSRSMEMKYFWLLDNEEQKQFNFRYHPGYENLGDLYTKAHNGKDTQHMRPFYVHTTNSPRFLERAQLPHIRRGCVETIRDSQSRIASRKLVRTRGTQARRTLRT